jgi:hypothetical protein
MAEDPKISQRYRELPPEEPSSAVDAAILAAARRAAETRPAPLVVPSGRRRWYFPLAAAAIIVLAVAVTIHVEREQPDPEIALPPVTAPESPKEEQAVQAQRDGVQAQPQPAPVPAPASPPVAQQPGVTSGTQEARQADAAAERRRSEVEQAPAAAARPLAKLAVELPEQWLERIAELRKQGKHEEADEALAEFRRAYPDYRLSDAMLENVEKK